MAKQTKRERKYSSDSFLEAFRDLGNNVVDGFKNDVVKGTGKGIADTLFGANRSVQEPSSFEGQPSNSGNLYQREADLENKYRKQARWQAEIFKKQENILFTRQDRETKLQVQALQGEIHQLVKASNELSKEAEIASTQVTPDVGVYHINFFEKLRNLIKALRSKIQESSYWLSEWNKKSKKKNYYWGQAKKHGSSFMLHNDRQVATQTG